MNLNYYWQQKVLKLLLWGKILIKILLWVQAQEILKTSKFFHLKVIKKHKIRYFLSSIVLFLSVSFLFIFLSIFSFSIILCLLKLSLSFTIFSWMISCDTPFTPPLQNGPNLLLIDPRPLLYLKNFPQYFKEFLICDFSAQSALQHFLQNLWGNILFVIA